jgi:hypothetical protein
MYDNTMKIVVAFQYHRRLKKTDKEIEIYEGEGGL